MNKSLALQPMAMLVPGKSLEAYVSAVSGIPVLSADEERALAERFYYNGDLDAARQMVLAHLRFVVHIARSYSGYGLPQADLVQEGNVGLMKAIKRFNPEKGVRLVSFAVHWIKAEMHEYILRNWRIVKIATTKAQRKLFFNLRGAKKKLGWLTNDEAQAIADDLNVSVTEVRHMEGRLSNADVAFDASNDDDDEEATYAPVYYLEDKNADPARQLEDENWEESTTDNLYKALVKLDERSQDILRARWLTDNKATLQELADKYQVSAERIRQLEQNAMQKLKSTMLA